MRSFIICLLSAAAILTALIATFSTSTPDQLLYILSSLLLFAIAMAVAINDNQ